MTTAAETERAQEQSAQPSAGSDSKEPADILVCIDRLRTLCPDAFKDAERRLGEGGFWPAVLQTIEHQVSAKGYGLLADMLEFAEAWTPDNTGQQTKPDEIRERVRRIAGLVEAAHLCEGSITHGSGDKNAIQDFFTAISGTIFVAANECRRLLADMDAEGGGA